MVSILKIIFEILKWLFSGLAIGLIVYSYHRFPRFYLLINRIKGKLLNISMFWNVTVTYQGEFNSDTLTSVAEMIRREFNRYNFQSKSNESILFQIEGFSVKIEFDNLMHGNPTEGSGVYNTFSVAISDIRTPFREAERLVERVTAILTNIERHLKPSSTKYGTTIEFEKLNPYFGLYARRLKATDVERFICVFHFHHAEQVDNTVIVSKESVEITSPQIPSFQQLSWKYLALSIT